MLKKKVMGISIGVLALIGIVIWFFLGKKKDETKINA